MCIWLFFCLESITQCIKYFVDVINNNKIGNVKSQPQ
jgi:hypothetical protein